jgi:hypothetical protein
MSTQTLGSLRELQQRCSLASDCKHRPQRNRCGAKKHIRSMSHCETYAAYHAARRLHPVSGGYRATANPATSTSKRVDSQRHHFICKSTGNNRVSVVSTQSSLNEEGELRPAWDARDGCNYNGAVLPVSAALGGARADASFSRCPKLLQHCWQKLSAGGLQESETPCAAT